MLVTKSDAQGRQKACEAPVDDSTYPYCVLILSTPAPTPTSIMPDLIAFAMSTHACRPELHWRFKPLTPAESGKPAAMAAARNSVAPPPGASTVPTATSSMSWGSILERSIRALKAPTSRSDACVSLKPPLPPLVIGVRRAQVMTICFNGGMGC